MIAADTNVLARYLVEDDARQAVEAAQLIEAAADGGQQLVVPQNNPLQPLASGRCGLT